MKKTCRTTISVIIMILSGCIGLYFGGIFNNAIGGAILGVLISGIACIIYVLYRQLCYGRKLDEWIENRIK